MIKMEKTIEWNKRKQISENFKILKSYVNDAIENRKTPNDTVLSLINEYGYEFTRDIIAIAITAIYYSDLRISKSVRAWADSKSPYTYEEIYWNQLFNAYDIHPSHLNQLGRAMLNLPNVIN